jgi:hypothetical protein
MESKPFMSAAALLVGLVLTGHGVQAETSNPSGPPEVEGDRAKQRTEGPPPVIQREDQGRPPGNTSVVKSRGSSA